MIKIKKEIEIPKLNYFSDIEGKVFFDIETTGLSAKSSICYLIGILYEESEKFYIEQFFAKNIGEEKEVIEEFFKKIEDFNEIISFNGDGFDIPFVRNRANSLGIKHGLKIKSTDILKLLRPHKAKLNVPNLKLKTLEKYAGIEREDKYDGGELIPIYFESVRNNDESLRDLILLHNFEDIKNMLFLDGILSEIFKREILSPGVFINQVSLNKDILKITGEFEKIHEDAYKNIGEDSLSITGKYYSIKIQLEESDLEGMRCAVARKYKKHYLSDLITVNPDFLPMDLMVYSAGGKLNYDLIKKTAELFLNECMKSE